MAASLVAIFDIRRAKDEDGNEVEVEVEYNDGALRSVPCLCTRKTDILTIRVIRNTGIPSRSAAH